MKKILVVLGTRPEAIKLAPVIIELRKYPTKYHVIICNTEQQKELSNQALSFFGLKADINLDIMSANQALSELQARLLKALPEVYKLHEISATIVQGDTMTVFCASLTSFYHKVPVFHVEAGLRSYDMQEPFPEEAIRQMTARIADIHFTPTKTAQEALLKEHINSSTIYMTGNTVIDALFCLSDEVLENARKSLLADNIKLHDKLVLITAHRRENHGERLDNILDAITLLAKKFKDHIFVLPVHPNPNVKTKVENILQALENIRITPPQAYPALVCLMQNAKLILTDSGGIQEEAPSFACPILVMRYETERNEGVELGFAKLVGADTDKICAHASEILEQEKEKTRLHKIKNPYGDGKASKNIVDIINNIL